MPPKTPKKPLGKSSKTAANNEEGTSSQSHIDGVNVVPQNWESSATATAGLLGLKDTESLREFTTHPHFLAIYNPFAEFRRKHFDLGGETDAAKSKAASVTDRKVFKFAHDPVYHKLIRQTDPIKTSSDVPETHIAPLNWLNAMTRIAIANPEMFTPDENGSYTNEDLYRIFQVIRWKWKSETNSRQGKGKFQNNLATPPTYFTDDDDPRSKKASDLTTVKDTDIQNASLPPINQPLDDDEPAQADYSAVTTAPPVAPESDFLEVFGNFVESIPANRDLETGTRPKLNPTTLRQTLEILTKQIKVTYDSRTTSEAAAQTYVSSALALEVVGEEDGKGAGVTQSNEFWELQGKLNRTCAPLPAYESACDVLGLDRYTPTLPGEGEIVLKPWQVVGIAWMVEQEDGPIKGGIVADDCGLGKTVLALALIHFAARRPRQIPYRPTVVVVPPGIVDTWIQEWRQHFKKTIKLLLFHGARSQTPDLVRQSLIIESKDFDGFLADLKDDDPSTLTVVILTTYSTWHSRSLLTVDVDDEEVSEDDDEEPSQVTKKKKTTKLQSAFNGKFDRVICDEGHKVKNFGTNAHKAIHLIHASYAWFLTATPMINRVLDLRGYLNILWNPAWKSDVTWDEAVSAYKSVTGGEPATDRLFLLDPKLFGRLSKKGVMDTVNAYAALPRILELIQMRRSMASVLTTVKGNTIRIGDTIPAYDVTTVELEMTSKEQTEFNRFFTPLIERLVRNSSTTDAEESEGGAHFDMTSYRRLCHLSYSTSLERLYKATSSRNTVSSINKWHEYRDHGLTWFMNKVKTDFAMPVIQNRSSCAFYLANTCPKLRYLSKIILEKVLGENRRVLIFAEWPMTQWHVEMFLVVLGIRTLSLRSRHSDEERTIIANQFNDPKYKVDVLITTYRTCSVGINLHKACHDVVMLEPAINANTILQSIGRVHRLGQKERQEIDILFVDHTFNRQVEHNQAKKMISQIVGQGKGVFGDVIERSKDAATARNDENEDSDSEATEKEETANMDIVRNEGDKILQKMLGQSRSRLEWDDPKDLGFSTTVTRGKATLLDRGQEQSGTVSTRTRQSTSTATKPKTNPKTRTNVHTAENDMPQSSVPLISPHNEIPSSPVPPITSPRAVIPSSSATQLPQLPTPLAGIVQDSASESRSSKLSSPPREMSDAHEQSPKDPSGSAEQLQASRAVSPVDVTVPLPNPQGNGDATSLQTTSSSHKRSRTSEDEDDSNPGLAESTDTAAGQLRRSKRLHTSKN